MKILFCPAHYAHLNNRGSEVEWAYRITKSLAEQNNNSVVVTGFTNIKSSLYNIVELQPTKSQINLGLINTIYFALSYGIYAVKILRQKTFDIHHHVLPFSLGRSFNLAFIFPRKNVKRIIGPIQKPIPAYADNLHDPLQRLSRVQLLKNTLLNAFVAVFALPLNVLSSLTLRRADVLVAINDDVKEALIKKGCEAQKIIVIPPGLNTSTFTRNGEQRCV